MLLCSLPKCWDDLATSISFSTIDTLDFESVVGAFLFEEVWRKSNIDISTHEALVASGRSIERGELGGTSRSKSKGNPKLLY
jgi:hypothetical protein